MKKSNLLCLGFAFLLGISIQAQSSSDDCSTAMQLTPGPIGSACIFGSNVGATVDSTLSADSSASCWASAPDATVWYHFTTNAAGSYTITTDQADGDGPDTQLQLFEGSSCSSLSFVDCDEDGGVCSGLSAEITATLNANTKYYVQIDIFDTEQDTFAISVIDNEAGVNNDCITTPTDISNFITNASSPFDCAEYAYLNVSAEDITEDNLGVGNAYNGCSNPSQTGDATHYAIWFKFTLSSAINSWLSITPIGLDKCDLDESENIFYSMHLFDSDFNTNGCDVVFDNPAFDCSIGDGLTSHGNNRDKAKGSFFDHPRLDLSNLGAGTYYLMVEQMARITVAPETRTDTIGFDPITGEPITVIVTEDVTTVAEPDNGKFLFTLEDAPSNSFTSDGVSANTCNNAQDITNTAQTGLTNAGAEGNLWIANGGTANPNAVPNEPGQYDYANSGRGYDVGCTGTTTVGAAGSTLNNNSVVYAFEVEDLPGTDGEVLCFEKDSIYEDILSDFDLLCDSLLILYPNNFPVIFDPQSGDTLLHVGGEIANIFGDTIVIPDDATCSEIRSVLVTILSTTFAQLPDSVCVPLNCSPSVEISFTNLSMCGNNDNGAAVYVTEGDCVNGNEVIFAPIDQGTTTLCLRSGAQPLNPGTYYIVVDGHGAGLAYDLSVNVDYKLGLGGADCNPSAVSLEEQGTNEESFTAVNELSNHNFSVHAVKPIPATQNLQVVYTAKQDLEKVTFSVMDMSGKTLLTKSAASLTTGTKTQNLNVSNLSDGVYILHIKLGDSSEVIRFTKTH